MLESAIQAHFIEQVRRYDLGLAFKVDCANRRGFPDVIFIAKTGETAFIEFKQDRGRLSRHQQVMHDDLIEIGADVITLKGLDMTNHFLRLVQDSQP